jgi:cell wall-associated NlpC family hydrolase
MLQVRTIRAKSAVAITFCGIALGVSAAQSQSRRNGSSDGVVARTTQKPGRSADLELSADDRLSIMAAALDSRVRIHSESDCSHLVHSIYERAGFSYAYAPSTDLYAGVEEFQRVKVPEPGDLVVWRGHAGIVVKPSQHIFFSFMRSGPGIDNYEASYWKSRGRPRFYRYIKNDRCAGCELARSRSHELARIKR